MEDSLVILQNPRAVRSEVGPIVRIGSQDSRCPCLPNFESGPRHGTGSSMIGGKEKSLLSSPARLDRSLRRNSPDGLQLGRRGCGAASLLQPTPGGEWTKGPQSTPKHCRSHCAGHTHSVAKMSPRATCIYNHRLPYCVPEISLAKCSLSTYLGR